MTAALELTAAISHFLFGCCFLIMNKVIYYSVIQKSGNKIKCIARRQANSFDTAQQKNSMSFKTFKKLSQ